jgi:selenide,water dikinase
MENRSGGLASNEQYFADYVNAGGIPQDLLSLFYDPQTSGGLLIAVDPGSAGRAEESLRGSGIGVWRIGAASEARAGIRVNVV